MFEGIMKLVNKTVGKEKLKIEWFTKGEEDLIAYYKGYNKKFAEIIEFKLTINSKGYLIEVSPLLEFDYLEHFKDYHDFYIKKSKEKRVSFCVKREGLDAKELVDNIRFMFSVDVITTYKILLIQEYQIGNLTGFDI